MNNIYLDKPKAKYFCFFMYTYFPIDPKLFFKKDIVCKKFNEM